MRKEKTWNLIGVILGLIVILVGIIFMFTPADHYYTDSADKASFGGDYYTYEYEATRIVAGNTAVTANNLRELGAKLALYAGAMFMVASALICLHYGKELMVCPTPAETAAEVPAYEPPVITGSEE